MPSRTQTPYPGIHFVRSHGQPPRSLHRHADPPTHHYRYSNQSTVFTYTSPTQDLCAGTYYTHAVPAIDLQLAKQGYRLAAWLNVIFDGDAGLP